MVYGMFAMASKLTQPCKGSLAFLSVEAARLSGAFYKLTCAIYYDNTATVHTETSEQAAWWVLRRLSGVVRSRLEELRADPKHSLSLNLKTPDEEANRGLAGSEHKRTIA